MLKNLKMSDLAVSSYEAMLLLELSPEIANFRKNFKGNVCRTYVLTPHGSSMFGFDIINGVPCVGVPERIFSIMRNISIDGVYVRPGITGIFVAFRLGRDDKKSLSGEQVAVRIFMRKRRVSALSVYKRLTLAPMDPNGVLLSKVEPFELDIIECNRLIWEDQ